MPRALSGIVGERMYILKRKTMLRAKILNVFRADYGVCCTIFIYPENRSIGSCIGELFLYRPL